jgi:Ca2+-binding RTX toxin-like protein
MGTSGNDFLEAGAGDIVESGAGDDTITGVVGATMRGGEGIDTLIFSAEGEARAITFNVAAQVASDLQLLSDTVVSGFDRFDIRLGNGNDTVDATAAHFVKEELQEDSFYGGEGTDTFILDSTTNGNVYLFEFDNLKADFSALKVSIVFDGYSLRFNGSNVQAWDPLQSVELVGGAGRDQIEGDGAGSDRVFGGAGNDRIRWGRSGADPSSATDVVDAGSGNDSVLASEGSIVRGGSGIDRLNFVFRGTVGITFNVKDQLSSEVMLGDSKITGFEHFEIYFGHGADSLDLRGAHFGTRYYEGAAAYDFASGFHGRSGVDTLVLDETTTGSVLLDEFERLEADFSRVAYSVKITAGYIDLPNFKASMQSNDIRIVNVVGGSADDQLEGGISHDTLAGGAGNDLMRGFGGNDVYITDGIDTLEEFADEGIDTVKSSVTYQLRDNFENLKLLGSSSIDGHGNSLANVITGNSGNNILNGNEGLDTLIGGNGNDFYVLATGDDIVNDTGGVDTIESAIGRSLLDYVTIENLVLTGTADINGTGNGNANWLVGNYARNSLSGALGDDKLDGGLSGDRLDGGEGYDTLIGGAGGDSLIGGIGTDTASYAGASVGVVANLKFRSGNLNDARGDIYSSIENLTGSVHSDTLTGDDNANRISGGSGNDKISGLLGKDLLVGGLAADIFVFNTRLGADNIDAIDDFVAVDDTIWLDRTIFSRLGGAGDLAPQSFYAGATAHDGSDRIIYDKTTGKVYYDADGTGGDAAVQFALLDKNLTLTASDFDIIA